MRIYIHWYVSASILIKGRRHTQAVWRTIARGGGGGTTVELNIFELGLSCSSQRWSRVTCVRYPRHQLTLSLYMCRGLLRGDCFILTSPLPLFHFQKNFFFIQPPPPSPCTHPHGANICDHSTFQARLFAMSQNAMGNILERVSALKGYIYVQSTPPKILSLLPISQSACNLVSLV